MCDKANAYKDWRALLREELELLDVDIDHVREHVDLHKAHSDGLSIEETIDLCRKECPTSVGF